jgi:hypothetical protein
LAEEVPLAWAAQSVVADLDETFGEHMLQKAADKLLRRQGAAPQLARRALFIAKRHLVVGDRPNPVVTEGDPKHVGAS